MKEVGRLGAPQAVPVVRQKGKIADDDGAWRGKKTSRKEGGLARTRRSNNANVPRGNQSKRALQRLLSRGIRLIKPINWESMAVTQAERVPPAKMGQNLFNGPAVAVGAVGNEAWKERCNFL